MSATDGLYSRWKALKGIQSDRQAAEALGVSHGAPHHWKNGRNAAPAIIEKMAKDLGEDAAATILMAFSEAAKDAADKRTLGRLARSLGAACFALVMLSPLTTNSAAAQSREGVQVGAHPIHYAKRLLRAFRAFQAWWPAFTEQQGWNHLASNPVRS